MPVIPVFFWWAVTIVLGVVAGRVAVDDKTLVEQIFGGSIQVIGYGIFIAIIIIAIGYAVKSNRKG